MARKFRVEYPGAICHVMNRGDRRKPIFKDAEDRRRFLETPGERRKGDAGKLAIALRLRLETTVTVGWIAERLRMGTRAHLAHLLLVKAGNGIAQYY